MEVISLFLLKSILVSGLLTAWYLIGLRGKRLHRYNRFFLLSILFFSLVIPLLHLRIFNIAPTISDNIAPKAWFIKSVATQSNTHQVTTLPRQIRWDWLSITGVIASGISLMLLSILFIRIGKLWRMCRKLPVIRVAGINLILTDAPRAPFTFLQYLFWKKTLPLQDDASQLILRHEAVHIKQRHTYDKLASQFLTCIFWFNPFYWIIQKELNIVHEFLADEQAVGNNDTASFAMMLLRSYNSGSYMVPEHHFYSSSVKRRLAMLQIMSKPSYTLLRRFIALPLVAGTILLFSFNVRNAGVNDITTAKKTIVLLLDAGHGGNDAGMQYGSHTEKDITLQYAMRIQQLAPAYNVDVQLTRNDDAYTSSISRIAISNKIHPDVFISLHVGDNMATDKSKGNYEMYVSHTNAYATKSNHYSNAIFSAMVQNRIIPGIPNTPHKHSPGCNCNTCTALAAAQNTESDKFLSTEREEAYVLDEIHAPGIIMILGDIKNREEMQQLTDNTQVDRLCNSMLKGIVEGVTDQEKISNDPLSVLPFNSGSKCN